MYTLSTLHPLQGLWGHTGDFDLPFSKEVAAAQVVEQGSRQRPVEAPKVAWIKTGLTPLGGVWGPHTRGLQGNPPPPSIS